MKLCASSQFPFVCLGDCGEVVYWLNSSKGQLRLLGGARSLSLPPLNLVSNRQSRPPMSMLRVRVQITEDCFPRARCSFAALDHSEKQALLEFHS